MNGDTRDAMMSRFELVAHDIKCGAKLKALTGQSAVFVYTGQLGDVFMLGLKVFETKHTNYHNFGFTASNHLSNRRSIMAQKVFHRYLLPIKSINFPQFNKK